MTDWNKLTDEFLQMGDSYFDENRKLVMRRIEVLTKPMFRGRGIRKVLDCGCSAAMWLPFFEELGFEYQGIDCCKYAINKAKEIYPDKNINLGFLQELTNENEFNFIICMSVLQHLEKDQKELVLINLVKALKPNGLLLLMDSTPTESNQYQLSREDLLEMINKLGLFLVESFMPNDQGNDDVYILRKGK